MAPNSSATCSRIIQIFKAQMCLIENDGYSELCCPFQSQFFRKIYEPRHHGISELDVPNLLCKTNKCPPEIHIKCHPGHRFEQLIDWTFRSSLFLDLSNISQKKNTNCQILCSGENASIEIFLQNKWLMMNCQGKSSIVLTKAKQWFGIFWHFPQFFVILYMTLNAMHLTYFGLKVV